MFAAGGRRLIQIMKSGASQKGVRCRSAAAKVPSSR